MPTTGNIPSFDGETSADCPLLPATAGAFCDFVLPLSFVMAIAKGGEDEGGGNEEENK